MLRGTRNICGDIYEYFRDASVKAAEKDMLPIGVEMWDVSDCKVSEFKDFFTDLHQDTGLEFTGRFFLDHETRKLAMILEVSRTVPEENERNPIQ